jgi:integrase
MSAEQRRPARRPNGDGTVYYDSTRRRWEGQLRVTAGDGTTSRRKVTAPTEAEARAKLRALAVAADEARLPRNRNVTVSAFLDEWAKNVLPDSVAPATGRLYADVIRLYIKPHLGKKRIASLRPSEVTAMVRQLSNAGLSPNTIRTARSVLRRALRYALHDGLVTRNAAADAFGIRVPPHQGRTMTPDQAREFITAVGDHRLSAAWTVALACGLRLGETLGLAWSDIDTTTRTLQVRRALKRHPSHGLELSEPKTASGLRTIHLPELVVQALAQHRNVTAHEADEAGDVWEPLPLGHDLIFRTPIGTAIDPANFRHETYRMTTAAGIGRWTPHELRHSAASLLIAQGVPLKTVSETLGHSSIRVTADVYGHLLDEGRKAAADAMDEALRPRDQ